MNSIWSSWKQWERGKKSCAYLIWNIVRVLSMCDSFSSWHVNSTEFAEKIESHVSHDTQDWHSYPICRSRTMLTWRQTEFIQFAPTNNNNHHWLKHFPMLIHHSIMNALSCPSPSHSFMCMILINSAIIMPGVNKVCTLCDKLDGAKIFFLSRDM